MMPTIVMMLILKVGDLMESGFEHVYVFLNTAVLERPTPSKPLFTATVFRAGNTALPPPWACSDGACHYPDHVLQQRREKIRRLFSLLRGGGTMNKKIKDSAGIARLPFAIPSLWCCSVW
jgi:hypothetical protein